MLCGIICIGLALPLGKTLRVHFLSKETTKAPRVRARRANRVCWWSDRHSPGRLPHNLDGLIVAAELDGFSLLSFLWLPEAEPVTASDTEEAREPLADDATALMPSSVPIPGLCLVLDLYLKYEPIPAGNSWM